jgi:hypothetical protein
MAGRKTRAILGGCDSRAGFDAGGIGAEVLC